MGVADDERQALCALFEQVGPDAPTLCSGWRTRDLAAHLVVRERRPDAVAGIAVPALAGRTRLVQDQFAARPWTVLVELVRTGPPRWSPFALPALNELVNAAEFFVHHEDVRRAVPEWAPRPAQPARDAAAWRALRVIARRAYRHSPVGVRLRTPDGADLLVRPGPTEVTITGEPGELLLHAFGRDEVRIAVDGDQQAVAAVQGLDRRF